MESGKEWQPVGKLEHVLEHDLQKGASKAVAYGIYGVAANIGWVSVGNDHDSPGFAAHALRT